MNEDDFIDYTDEELDALAEITDADIVAADQAWQRHTKRPWKDLLRAEEYAEPTE